MWLVVNFILDDTVEVVPQKWLNIKKGICGWPKFTKKIDVERAVRNKTKANKKEFNFFEARAMSSLIDSYTKAIKKCNIAKLRSDLSSCAEETKFKKKKRNQRKASVLSSNSDGEMSDTSLKSDSLPLCSTDDELEIRKSIQGSSKGSKYEDIMTEKNLSIYKKPNNGWSPLKSSADSSFVTPTTVHSLINDDIILNTTSSKTNSCEIIDSICHAPDKTPETRTITTLSSQNSIHKDHSPNLSAGANRRLIFSDLDSSQTIVMNKSPIMSSKPSFAENKSLPKTLSDDSTTSNSKKFKHDDNDAFKKSVLHQLLTIKFEIRSMDEKLNFILKLVDDDKKNSSASEKNADLTNFDVDFPIKSFDELDDIENKISNDNTYRLHLVQYISSVGGLTVKIMVKRIMALLFIPDLLTKFSYNGRCNKKRSFHALVITKIIFESVLKIKKFSASDTSRNEIEQVLKYILIQTPFKLKKQDPNKESPADNQMIDKN